MGNSKNSFVVNQVILLADTILVSSFPIGMLVLFGNSLGKCRADILFLEGKDQTVHAQRKVYSITAFSLLRTSIPLSVGTYLWRKEFWGVMTMFYLSTLITKRWQTVETEVNRSIWSAEMQSPDWCKILHVMNSGMLANPVRRSERARLHSNRFVIVLKCFFFNTRINTSPLTRTINTPSIIGGTSSFALKLSVL